ncbi:MAG: ABC transporter ATP-binding protein [Spirochaetes bacterium]|nr:ABC transporter ATP-binding protein [Spirochaetota bacterium]MBN2769475.1 ABC transporter ATP-binding protein [Spirochaetota bacterium]
MEYAVKIKNLSKSYGDIQALNDFGLSVKRGEIFGLLGHNGAGKTTAVECMLGLRKKDFGSVELLGMDPQLKRRKLFEKVGVQFQHTGFQDKIKVEECCRLTASLYEKRADWLELLEKFRLDVRRDHTVSDLSGGEKQKLAVIQALIGKPELLFLDELTTGLDPEARRDVWDYLKGLSSNGITIVLTSHFMDEVEYLCDNITVLKKGKTIASGNPGSLILDHGHKNLEELFLSLMRSDKGDAA